MNGCRIDEAVGLKLLKDERKYALLLGLDELQRTRIKLWVPVLLASLWPRCWLDLFSVSRLLFQLLPKRRELLGEAFALFADGRPEGVCFGLFVALGSGTGNLFLALDFDYAQATFVELRSEGRRRFSLLGFLAALFLFAFDGSGFLVEHVINVFLLHAPLPEGVRAAAVDVRLEGARLQLSALLFLLALLLLQLPLLLQLYCTVVKAYRMLLRLTHGLLRPDRSPFARFKILGRWCCRVLLYCLCSV